MDLQEIYKQRLVSKISKLEEFLALLEQSQSLEEDVEEELRRMAHSLKGSGGSYGFPEITEAAGKIEVAPLPSLKELLTDFLNLLRTIVKT